MTKMFLGAMLNSFARVSMILLVLSDASLFPGYIKDYASSLFADWWSSNESLANELMEEAYHLQTRGSHRLSSPATGILGANVSERNISRWREHGQLSHRMEEDDLPLWLCMSKRYMWYSPPEIQRFLSFVN